MLQVLRWLIAFRKDGVLLRGETVLEPTRNAFRILHGDNPFNRWPDSDVSACKNVLTPYYAQEDPVHLCERWPRLPDARWSEGMTPSFSVDQRGWC